MSSCDHCGRRAQLPLCTICTDQLSDMLTDLVWLLRELETAAARQDRLTVGVSRLIDHPAPANMGAVDLLRSVGAQLEGIAAFSVPPRLLAWWLHRHLDDLVRREDAARCFRTIQHLVGMRGRGPIHDVINRPDRRFAGPCPECGEICHARQDDVYTVCKECGTPIDVDRNRDRTIAEHDLLPERMLLRTLDNLNEHVPRVRFYSWVKEGKLPSAGYLSSAGVVARRGARHDPKVYSLARTRALRRRERVAPG